MKKETKFWLSLGIVLTLSISSQCLAQEKEDKKNEQTDREIIRQELVRNRMIANQELKWFEERHKKLHEKDKSISNARLVLSYLLIGAAGYYLGYVSSKEDGKDWGWKKEVKKDDWKRKWLNCYPYF